MDIKIESNIPLPPSKTAKTQKGEWFRQCLAQCNPGDSFTVDSAHDAQLVGLTARSKGFKTAYRREGEHWRVWLLA